MRFEIIYPGKTKEDYLARGVDDFAQRLSRYIDLELKALKAPRPGKGDDEARLIREEGRLLLSRIPDDTLVVALDPGGRLLSSPELADLLGNWQEQGRSRLVFVLGGPLGLSAEVLSRADFTLSLSPMTFTHEMARLLLLEQLYRAWSIRLGTGYHK
ncbi:23S rRNA (pseudouridine(1915)-N(3))-methyltransferase RlmH [Desulfurivibrio alkaliphilus]|uniref:Ribosomal RNA large subunit methyltransferase H n=1 Tax=Desulfurivibrio alkaliphilus (strain DSM 19089 / UNIQEM U267 / AHT2) TaxID=589865 RepID=D6Z1F3_DESAT|nr:23S rRNA (pseudouridine(1915)-N(3))-methyltransferase RlmH [Desulfurivibrio alkaliphilus]ADH85408.1 protein of unknown function DUF163 [Desulfurivibrio alkaliphilus AHT 2]